MTRPVLVGARPGVWVVLLFAGWVGGAAVTAAAQFHDLAVPRPAVMIREAGVIAEGVFEGAPGALLFRPTRILKGTGPDTVPWKVEYQRVGDSDFDADIPRLRAAPRLFLGRKGLAEGSVSLSWLNEGVWPGAYSLREFPAENVQTCRAYVEAVLGYAGILASAPDDLPKRLLDDAAKPKTWPALLGFVDAYLDESARVPRDFRRDLLASIAAGAVSDLPRLDVFTRRNLANLAPELPPSLGVTILASESVGATELDRREALVQGRAILAARGLVRARECRTLEEFREAAKRHEPTLRKADARRLLNLFDSEVPEMRAAAHGVMAAVLGLDGSTSGSVPELEPRSNLPIAPAAAKAYWREQIRLLEERRAVPE
ncbi:MAG: hypothetical protein AB7O66_07295 [Limisphaerales bacterium]